MPTLNGHSLRRGLLWIVVLLTLILITGHGFILYYASSHMALSAGVVAGVVLLIFIKHLGVLGLAFDLFRRRLWKR